MGVINEVTRAKTPFELAALLKYAYQSKQAKKELTAQNDPHWQYAYQSLCNVSRSFAMVIMQLQPQLRNPICIFYLVLRALDTVEDDTSADDKIRQHICRNFWTYLPNRSLLSDDINDKLLSTHAPSSIVNQKDGPNFNIHDHLNYNVETDDEIDKLKNINASTAAIFDNDQIEEAENQTLHEGGWSSSQFGKDAEKELCEKFDTVVKCFSELDLKYQKVIIYITKRMGAGMADHINDTSCDTTYDYKLYCHFVAGLVGFGLTDIFVISSSNKELANLLVKQPQMSNSMGLFLQQTNIIRDYLEDIIDGRTFWPEDIWNLYSKQLQNLKNIDSEESEQTSLNCLNHMVFESLKNIDDCLKYMEVIYEHFPEVFKFVAIPQVMAIATLNEVYNNVDVYKKVVKIRRAKTCLLISQTQNMQAVYKIFYSYGKEMLGKMEGNSYVDIQSKLLLNNVVDLCYRKMEKSNNLIYLNIVSIILFSILSSYVLKRRQDHFDGAVFTWRSADGIMEPMDMLAIGTLFLVCVYMFAFFLLPYVTNLHQEDWSRLHLRQSPTTSQEPSSNSSPGATRCPPTHPTGASAPQVVELDENGTVM